MTVKFLSIFIVTRHTMNINETKGLSYADKSVTDGRDLRPKLDYKTNKNGTSESLLPARVETGQKSLYCGYNRSR